MPSPIAHLGAGYAIYRYYKHRLPQDQRCFWNVPLQLVIVMGLSMVPDLDVIPAIIFRDMEAYHNNFSHSLIFALPIALLIAGIFHRIYRSSFWLWFVICLLSYDLHVIMDSLTAERGVMMFWPLTQVRFASPMKLFFGVQWGLGWFSIWHLWTVCTELLFALVLTAVVNFSEKRKNTTNTIPSQER
jgi:membrane-bound metal-dependent hydrolase YbcI (DUF457 family)